MVAEEHVVSVWNLLACSEETEVVLCDFEQGGEGRHSSDGSILNVVLGQELIVRRRLRIACNQVVRLLDVHRGHQLAF